MPVLSVMVVRSDPPVRYSARDLIIRYTCSMKTMTATEASRHFSDLLDAVERGETITIVRGSHPVAEIGPAHRRTGADLRAALADVPPPDEEFSRHIAEAVALLRSEVIDPWAGA
jgi:prevent-host-death family protein